MSLPRGIRNHNPLNIRRSKDQWKGMAEVQTDRADRPCLCTVQEFGMGLARSVLPAHPHLLSQVPIVYD